MIGDRLLGLNLHIISYHYCQLKSKIISEVWRLSIKTVRETNNLRSLLTIAGGAPKEGVIRNSGRRFETSSADRNLIILHRAERLSWP